MNTAGSKLKSEREKQKRSLEEISKKLKIKIEYLRAIEDDNYQLLPAEVFTKAYIRLYADLLQIESDELVRLYSDEITEPSPVEPVVQDAKKTTHYKQIIVIASVLLITAMAFLVTKRDEQKPVEEFEEVVHEVIESEIIESEVVKSKIEKAKAEEVTVEEMSLEIIAEELTWLSVSKDGAKPEEWLLRTGESITLTASEGFVIKVGNAGGTKLVLNGKDMGELGPYGKVVEVKLP